MLEDKHKGVRPKSIYTVSFLRQVQTLTVRQMQMILGNKFDIFVSFATTIAIALIVGGIFLNLPQTAAGGFTRGGVLFIGLLFNALTAFNELPTQMGGRPVLFKQMNYAFYRPSALSLAQLLADIPLSISRIFLFSIILYFMAGLRRTGGAFFTFFIFVYVGYLAMAALFRLFGTVCKSYDVAARLAAVDHLRPGRLCRLRYPAISNVPLALLDLVHQPVVLCVLGRHDERVQGSVAGMRRFVHRSKKSDRLESISDPSGRKPGLHSSWRHLRQTSSSPATTIFVLASVTTRPTCGSTSVSW